MKSTLVIAATLVLLGACGAAPRGPEPVPVDRVNCARCGMLISSDANAAQSLVEGHAPRFFDDIGCLASDDEARAQGTSRYVRLASGGWATTEAAHFARSPSAKTPMDYGVLAFATTAEAETADRDNRARVWPEILKLVEEP
jgi:copper chaperone NosL